jgi:hypothetical protein
MSRRFTLTKQLRLSAGVNKVFDVCEGRLPF